jgi:hypothetical protein
MQELSHDIFGIAMQAIDSVIQFSHFLISDFAVKIIERASDLRVLLKRLLTHDRDRLIRGKVAQIILQDE